MMAKPRIFISSTYYDLKHIRSSLEGFIEALGFEPILSEKGNIPYSPDLPLDESCYMEVGDSDIYVLIIGGRYGSEQSGDKQKIPEGFYEKYESITKKEYQNAVDKDIPIYVLIEKSVNSDFETYLKNKDNKSINYVHVDSINIFHFIESILHQPRNNPVHYFDRYGEIERWLKEQWSGLFRDLLRQRSRQKQLSSLSGQVSQLSEINETLKRYLEEVMSKVAPEKSEELIEIESKRLEVTRQLTKLEENHLYLYLSTGYGLTVSEFMESTMKSKTPKSFINNLIKNLDEPKEIQDQVRYKLNGKIKIVIRDMNDARQVFGLSKIKIK